MSGLTWFGWLFLVLELIGVVLTITSIGEPRKPMTSATAATLLLWNIAIAICILSVGTGRFVR